MHKVLINSLPKSGTNLLAQILDLYNFKENEHLGSGLFLSPRLIPRIRNLIYKDIKDGYEIGIDTPVKIRKKYIEKILRNCKVGGYVTSHLGYNDLLIDYIKDQKFKIIFMVRDPRAVLNSSYNYILNNHNHKLNAHLKKMSVKKRYESLIYGEKVNNFTLNSIKQKYDIINKFKYDPSVLTIKFENIIGSKGGGSDELKMLNIQNIANFIKADLSKTKFVSENFFGPGRKTFRRGNIESWRDEMPFEVVMEATNEFKSILSSWDYPI
ncbi:MAG: hypothetical protein ACI9JT_000857 [Polaribacter sp.]|jgi:hypothetical protein